jgi:hypothetical protein
MQLTKEEITSTAEFIKSGIYRDIYNNIVQFTYERMAREGTSTVDTTEALKVIKKLKTLL